LCYLFYPLDNQKRSNLALNLAPIISPVHVDD